MSQSDATTVQIENWIILIMDVRIVLTLKQPMNISKWSRIVVLAFLASLTPNKKTPSGNKKYLEPMGLDQL